MLISSLLYSNQFASAPIQCTKEKGWCKSPKVVSVEINDKERNMRLDRKFSLPHFAPNIPNFGLISPLKIEGKHAVLSLAYMRFDVQVIE